MPIDMVFHIIHDSDVELEFLQLLLIFAGLPRSLSTHLSGLGAFCRSLQVCNFWAASTSGSRLGFFAIKGSYLLAL